MVAEYVSAPPPPLPPRPPQPSAQIRGWREEREVCIHQCSISFQVKKCWKTRFSIAKQIERFIRFYTAIYNLSYIITISIYCLCHN